MTVIGLANNCLSKLRSEMQMAVVIPNNIKLNKSKNQRQKSVKTASGGRYAAHLCEAAVPAVTAN